MRLPAQRVYAHPDGSSWSWDCAILCSTSEASSWILTELRSQGWVRVVSSLHPFTTSRKGVMVSSRRLHKVMLRGHSVSRVVARGTTASNAQAGIRVGKRAGTDQGLMVPFCARALQAFPKSSQNQREISLNKQSQVSPSVRALQRIV